MLFQKSNQEIGGWFMKPTMTNSNTSANDLDENGPKYLVSANEKVILYLHGNSRTRSAEHRYR